MARYAQWEDLEKLLENSDEANKKVAARHPDLMMKWNQLRKRIGKHCPMARGCLKLITMYEADNDKFIQSTQEGRWIE